MRSDWPRVQLGEVAEEITVGHVGPMASEYVRDGIPFLRSQNVERLRLALEDTRFITPAFHERLRKSALRPGDVVIVRTGKPGTCAVVPSTLPVANCSDLVVVRPGPKLVPRFLAYMINSSGVAHVAAHLVGAVQQHFNVGSARSLEFHLPTLDEQERISRTLGVLDDKIELNRRLNETMEELARTIFKSWFVDFEPVRAKAEGRQPVAIDAGTAALFPARLVDSEVGTVPEGWRTGTLGDLIELKRGYDLPAAQRQEGSVPICSSSGVSGLHNEAKAKAPGVVTGRYGTIGQVFYMDEDFWPLNTTLYVRNFKGNEPRFVAYTLARVKFANYADKAAVPGLNRNHLHEDPVVLVPVRIQKRFSDLCGPLWDRCSANTNESRTLAELRDLLLPKLISGELRVPAAEKIVEAAL